jgi:hypothetical protein
VPLQNNIEVPFDIDSDCLVDFSQEKSPRNDILDESLIYMERSYQSLNNFLRQDEIGGGGYLDIVMASGNESYRAAILLE